MKSAIQNRARELGFDACRFTTAAPPVYTHEFGSWLAAQHHGEMEWISRNAHKRVDPQQVLSGAKTVVTLAVNYGRESRVEGREPTGHQLTGVVARYAQFSDYHDIIGERVKKLT